MFEALLLSFEDEVFTPAVSLLSRVDLPEEGDVLVDVYYSSLNFKDALAVTNQAPIVRAPFPFVPGIDLVGRIVESNCDRFDAGELVIGTGGGLGETSWGGYAGMQRIRSDCLVRLPDGLSPHNAMAIGTAGLTAMLSIMALERERVRKNENDIIVTGASGGVGSFSVLLLSKAGFPVTASTGKTVAHAYLRSLGASNIIDRDVLGTGSKRPLDSSRWSGAVDTVGGSTLEAIISQVGRHGSIAVCGLAGDAALNTTVYPFILRGVNLLGIDSNMCPLPMRRAAWKRLSETLDEAELASICTTVPLAQVTDRANELLAGNVIGRTVVDLTSA